MLNLLFLFFVHLIIYFEHIVALSKYNLSWPFIGLHKMLQFSTRHASIVFMCHFVRLLLSSVSQMAVNLMVPFLSDISFWWTSLALSAICNSQCEVKAQALQKTLRILRRFVYNLHKSDLVFKSIFKIDFQVMKTDLFSQPL